MPRALDRLPGFLYDTCMARAERRWLSGVRAGLLQQTGGTIVEIGAGTGANLPHYPRRDVTRLDAKATRQGTTTDFNATAAFTSLRWR